MISIVFNIHYYLPYQKSITVPTDPKAYSLLVENNYVPKSAGKYPVKVNQ